MARAVELERRLGLNSSNSGKPPSSDGLHKPKREPRTRSLREPSGKPSGGQKGHKGETLRQVADPNVTIDHHPETCGTCGLALTAAMATRCSARQVFDLPEPQPLIVTEHRAYRCRCGRCGGETRAPFPEEVMAPVQYGPRLLAVVVYLLHYQLLPEDRLAEAMADLFGVRLVAATLARMSRSCAERFSGFAEAVGERVKAAPVKHLDETGFRTGGRTQWLHIACTVWLTFYRISPKRGSLLSDVMGIVVHDHWKPYYTMEGVRHALCNAHHLRELQALVDIEKEEWARKMQRLLRRACHATHLARDRGVPLEPRFVDQFRRRYDIIVTEGLGVPPGPAAACHTGNQRRPQATGATATTHRPQSPPAPQHPQGRRAALPGRSHRALHQQSGRARRAHDEGQAENLRRLPVAGRGSRLRRDPLPHLDRQEAGLERHSRSDPRPSDADRRSPRSLNAQGVPGQ